MFFIESDDSEFQHVVVLSDSCRLCEKKWSPSRTTSDITTTVTTTTVPWGGETEIFTACWNLLLKSHNSGVLDCLIQAYVFDPYMTHIRPLMATSHLAFRNSTAEAHCVHELYVGTDKVEAVVHFLMDADFQFQWESPLKLEPTHTLTSSVNCNSMTYKNYAASAR